MFALIDLLSSVERGGERDIRGSAYFGRAVTAEVYRRLGGISYKVERYDRLRRMTGDRVYEANSLHRLGDNHAATGNPHQVVAVWREALGIMADIGHPDTDKVAAKLADGAR